MKIFTVRFQVRSYECDFYGHVNNATYLNYLEFARMQTLMENGFTLKTMQDKGYMVVVRRIEIDYKYPLFMGDEVEIKTFTSEARNTSGTFTQQIMIPDKEKMAGEAKVIWVFTNLKGKPIPIPQEIRDAFEIR